MPELPEVEAQRRMLHNAIIGATVHTVNPTEQGGGPRHGLFDDKVIAEGVDQQKIVHALQGKHVIAARRRGKQLWLELADVPNGKCTSSFLIHLGMTGNICISGMAAPKYKNFAVDESNWPPRFTKLELILKASQGQDIAVAYTDPRRFGRLLLRDSDALASPPLSALAADPVVAPPEMEWFRDNLREFSAPVKAVLLDQNKLVCGVGNWIADEVLYQSEILPSAQCNTLSASQCTRLYSTILRVCEEACECNGDSSSFPDSWLFHYRWAKQTKGSISSPLGSIHFDTVGGRTTAFIPKAQRKGEIAPTSRKLSKAKSRSASKGKPSSASEAKPVSKPKGNRSGSGDDDGASGLVDKKKKMAESTVLRSTRRKVG